MSDILKQYDDFESIECYYESSMKINEPLVRWISNAAAEITRLRAELAEVQAENDHHKRTAIKAGDWAVALSDKLKDAQAQLAVAREGLEDIFRSTRAYQSWAIARDTLAKLDQMGNNNA